MISETNAVRLESTLLEKVSKYCSTRQGRNHRPEELPYLDHIPC
jgi:hypothetical protein